MKGILNHQQVEYVLYHLGHHIVLNDAIKKSFVYIKPGKDISRYKNKILFLLSDKQYDPFDVSSIGEIPVLFPVIRGADPFTIENGNIIFNHDLLKSSFYLLSGYQERDPGNLDSLGRFPYYSSVQSHLNMMTRPMVNYYFDAIINGLGEYCRIHNTEYKRRNVFSNFAFFLTHDVDRVSYYNFNSLLTTLKQLTGFLKTGKTRSFLLREIMDIGSHIIYNPGRSDPFWNFSFLTDVEKKLGIRSTWFFLPEDQKHIDSYYKLNDQKITGLIRFLLSEGHEIGLHGTVRSHNSYEALVKIKKDLISVTGKSDTGIRQHRLMWKHPYTAQIHEEAGILYDTTLGFAGCEGFRNSYCHPFRLFDFENDRMLSTWEIPLNIMESTLFDYRKLDFGDALKSVNNILGEVSSFKGVFTLLWHNNYFNERERPGITGFYSGLLERIMSEKPDALTGLEIIRKLN